MKKYLLLLSLAITPAVWADEASHRALATQVVEASDGAKSLQMALPTLLAPMTEGMKKQGLSDALVEELRQAVTKWFNAEIKWEELKPQVVELYMKEYTEPELKEMLTFFQSPVGKKILAQMPVVMQKSAALGQAYFQTKQASLQSKLSPIIEKAQAQTQGKK
jgi:hypothetical protein